MQALNTKVTKITSAIKTANKDKNIAIHTALTFIDAKVEELKNEYGISNTKAIKAIKDTVFNFDDKVAPELNRAFKVIITARLRNMNIEYGQCTLSQLENLVKYGTVAGVNGIDYDDLDAIRDYIKTLKTRIIETKTFPRRKA